MGPAPVKSILFSLYQHFRTLKLRDAVTDTLRAMLGLVRALFTPTGDATVVAALRLSYCEKCPFFDSKWKTCGTPGEVVQGDDGAFKIGCWCYLPLASRDPKKDCWARFHDIKDNGEVVGWPDVLRPEKT